MLKLVKNFLKKIEEQNNESFGKGRIDCCDLNKKGHIKKVDNNKQ